MTLFLQIFLVLSFACPCRYCVLSPYLSFPFFVQSMFLYIFFVIILNLSSSISFPSPLSCPRPFCDIVLRFSFYFPFFVMSLSISLSLFNVHSKYSIIRLFSITLCIPSFFPHSPYFKAHVLSIISYSYFPCPYRVLFFSLLTIFSCPKAGFLKCGIIPEL